VKPEYFEKVPSLGIVMNNVNNSLLVHFKEAKISSEQAIWESMDRVIDTKVQRDLYGRNHYIHYYSIVVSNSRAVISIHLFRRGKLNRTPKKEIYGHFFTFSTTNQKKE
jgi:hypothetical protein